jgi:hypothetical protein
VVSVEDPSPPTPPPGRPRLVADRTRRLGFLARPEFPRKLGAAIFGETVAILASEGLGHQRIPLACGTTLLAGLLAMSAEEVVRRRNWSRLRLFSITFVLVAVKQSPVALAALLTATAITAPASQVASKKVLHRNTPLFPDRTAPELSRATLENKTLRLIFSEARNESVIPDRDAFSLKIDDEPAALQVGRPVVSERP